MGSAGPISETKISLVYRRGLGLREISSLYGRVPCPYRSSNSASGSRTQTIFCGYATVAVFSGRFICLSGRA